LQVGQEAAARLVVGMGNVVSHPGPLARDLADSGHILNL
jgi:hypothetical protein